MPFPVPPLFWSPDRSAELWRTMSLAIRGLLSGKHNAVHTITLTPNALLTEFVDELIDSQTRVFLQPMTASAAASVASVYVVTTAGRAQIHHDSDPATDRDFALTHAG